MMWKVAPLAGAWIEMPGWERDCLAGAVAPLAGVIKELGRSPRGSID